jgi:hypothetical protein
LRGEIVYQVQNEQLGINSRLVMDIKPAQ